MASSVGPNTRLVEFSIGRMRIKLALSYCYSVFLIKRSNQLNNETKLIQTMSWAVFSIDRSPKPASFKFYQSNQSTNWKPAIGDESNNILEIRSTRHSTNWKFDQMVLNIRSEKRGTFFVHPKISCIIIIFKTQREWIMNPSHCLGTDFYSKRLSL